MRRVPGEKGVLSSAMILTMVVSAVLLPGQVHARNGRAEPARPVTRAAVAGQSTVIQPEAVMLNPADIPSWMGMAYFFPMWTPRTANQRIGVRAWSLCMRSNMTCHAIT